MTKLIDRQLMISYLKSYAICLICLLGLYIVVDLFNNIDDFARVKGGLVPTLKHIFNYYAVQTAFIFDRLSEAIVLLAAMFTVAWLQRNNELLPLLSAGISTRRVLRPVLIAACALVLVNIANQELLLPRLQLIPRGDPEQEGTIPVSGAYDINGVHMTGHVAVRKTLEVSQFTCNIPSAIADGNNLSLQARKAVYVPPANRPRTGGWMLLETQPPTLPKELQPWTRRDVLESLKPGTYFLYTSEVDFDRLTRDSKFFQNMSTWEVYQELGHTESTRLASMAVFFHMRLTRPLLGMILVVMGLSVILRDQNRNVFISAGSCLVLCAVFFGACMFARHLGDQEFFAPALAAWLPVFVFGPLAFVLFDAVHT